VRGRELVRAVGDDGIVVTETVPLPSSPSFLRLVPGKVSKNLEMKSEMKKPERRTLNYSLDEDEGVDSSSAGRESL
jgi:hypothetical protein